MVSVPHTTSQHDDVRRHFLGHHVTQIHPMQFISAIMGSGGTSFFGGPMGSYEVKNARNSSMNFEDGGKLGEF